jgi:hypothetical protein
MNNKARVITATGLLAGLAMVGIPAWAQMDTPTPTDQGTTWCSRDAKRRGNETGHNDGPGNAPENVGTPTGRGVGQSSLSTAWCVINVTIDVSPDFGDFFDSFGDHSFSPTFLAPASLGKAISQFGPSPRVLCKSSDWNLLQSSST